MWGTLIQLGGQAYGAEMNSRATNRSVKNNRMLRALEGAYGKLEEQDSAESDRYLRGLSSARSRNQMLLAQRLNGQGRLDAGVAGEDDYARHLAEVLGETGGMVDTANGSPMSAARPGAGATWMRGAQARTAPRLGSQANLVRLAGRRQGMNDYTQDTMDSLAEADIGLNRKVGERGRRSALLAAYRNRMMATAMRKYGGDPGASLRANGAMVSGIAGAAGAGINSYMANRPASSGATTYSGADPGGYDNSPDASDRPQGPSQYNP